MAGICGWLDSRQNATHTRLDSMAARLDSHTAQRLHAQVDHAALAASSPFGDISVRQADGVLVALRGRIHSEDTEIAAIIARHGSAAGVLAAWQRAGRAGLTLIHGSFALAVCDTLHDTMLLAVDRAGA